MQRSQWCHVDHPSGGCQSRLRTQAASFGSTLLSAVLPWDRGGRSSLRRDYTHRRRAGMFVRHIQRANVHEQGDTHFALIAQETSASPPASQVVPLGNGGSFSEPKSPCLNHGVGEICAPLCERAGVPPAIPHASKTGAVPGARQGVDIHRSPLEPFAALLLYDRNSSGSVGFMPLEQKSVFFPA